MNSETKPDRATLSLSELLSLDVKLEWAVEGIFPKEGIGVICGMPWTCKSWILHDLALAMACRRPWLRRFEVGGGPVLYIDEENPLGLLVHRFKKLLFETTVNPASLDIDFLCSTGFTLTKLRDEQWLSRIIGERGYSIIIVDSLIRVHQKEENSATEMAQVFK